jgi:putative ABC transport system substrate-binding protein
MKRRHFITLIGSIAAWPLTASAQQSARPRRLGILMSYEKDSKEFQAWLTTFKDAMERLGWTEGKNISFEPRWTGNDAALLEQAAKELVTLQPDLILSPSSPATGFLLKQTRTIPVVFVNIVDPVGQGFIASMSHPGGNATGLIGVEPSMGGKWIELLKQIKPQMSRVVVPFNPASAPYADFYLKIFKSTAPNFGVEVISEAVGDMSALDSFLAAQARDNTGVIPMPSSFATGHASEIAAMTVRYRLAAVYTVRPFAASGGLLSYGNDIGDNFRQAAIFVDRILKGEKPSDLPVQFPTKFSLVINLKTAKTFGLSVPLPLQASADEVIE